MHDLLLFPLAMDLEFNDLLDDRIFLDNNVYQLVVSSLLLPTIMDQSKSVFFSFQLSLIGSNLMSSK